MGWLKWAALAVTLAFVIWAIFANRDRGQQQAMANRSTTPSTTGNGAPHSGQSQDGQTQNGQAQTGQTQTGQITDSESISRGQAALVGRSVSLENVQVGEMAGNRGAFWLGQDQNRVLVVPGPEGAGNMQAGQRLNLTGTVHSIQDREKFAQQWKIDANDLKDQQIYVQANNISRATGTGTGNR